MIVNLKNLPKNIYDKLPLSIRIFKDEYELYELPMYIQNLIEPYFNSNSEINYFRGFDIKPQISIYNDLEIIKTISDLIIDRLKNFIMILPNNYPFNSILGCKLKHYIQNKDTFASQSLINTELNNIVNIVKTDIGHNIKIVKKEIIKNNIDSYVEYNLKLILEINKQQYNLNFTV